MHHVAAIAASLIALGLIGAIYYCNIIARPGSWARSEMLGMILLSLFTGLFPLAVAASAVGLWEAFTQGAGLKSALFATTDLVAIAGIVATVLVFRALLRATYRTSKTPNNVTPLASRSVADRTNRRNAA